MMKSTRSRDHGDGYASEIISHAVWLYYRFGIRLRDVEDRLARLGIIVTYQIIHRWCTKFGLDDVRRLKRRQGRLPEPWFPDEVVITVRGTSSNFVS